MRHAVIMAGGSGKRLWPLSRANRPKQLLPLMDGRSLLELAVDRLDGQFAPQNILIVTNGEYAEQIAQALPQIPRDNIIGEPEGRDTANAIALAAEILSAKDPDGVMAVFTADHVIRPVDMFAETIDLACRTAERHRDALLTFGIRPTWPHTGLGYIECDGTLEEGVSRVSGFKEKPDHGTARRYVESGTYYWNSGMFVWHFQAIRAALEKYLPDSAAKLKPVGQAVRAGKAFDDILRKVYPTLTKISIDYAVLEKADKVLVVELKCEWLDIGSWPALEDVAELDGEGNVVIAENAVLMDSTRNVVVSCDDHLLAVVGMDDCIIVRSGDATLVCNKSDSQRLKELLERIESKYGKKYL